MVSERDSVAKVPPESSFAALNWTSQSIVDVVLGHPVILTSSNSKQPANERVVPAYGEFEEPMASDGQGARRAADLISFTSKVHHEGSGDTSV